MARRSIPMPGLVMLAFLAALACGCVMEDRVSDPDQPVRSVTDAANNPQIAQGITGRVSTATGQPIVDARITAQSLDHPARPIPDVAMLSDAQGVFTWPLPPGKYRISAISDEGEIASRPAIVTAGAVTTIDLSAKP